MKMTNKEYSELTKQVTPPSPKLKNMVMAFLIGGLICTIGQGLKNFYTYLKLDDFSVKAAVAITLIAISAILTGLGLYEKIAKHAGAGTLVPITGFANAVVSSAIEFKTEGFVLGLGAKMFVIAGPVIVYGITASIIWGLIAFAFKLF